MIPGTTTKPMVPGLNLVVAHAETTFLRMYAIPVKILMPTLNIWQKQIKQQHPHTLLETPFE